jgi:hypothetical protein
VHCTARNCAGASRPKGTVPVEHPEGDRPLASYAPSSTPSAVRTVLACHRLPLAVGTPVAFK